LKFFPTQFDHRVLSDIRKILNLLSRRDKSILLLFTLFAVALAALDLFGIMLIGVIGSLSVTSISSGVTGDRVLIVLETLRLNEKSLQSQVSIIGTLAAVTLMLKTFISMWITKKTLYFFALRGSNLTSNLVAKFFTLPISKLNDRASHNAIYALTTGVNTLMLGVIGLWATLIADISLLTILSLGLFYVDPATAFATFFFFSFVALIMYRLTKSQVITLGKEQAEIGILSAQKISESMSAYREIFVANRRGFYAHEIGKLRRQVSFGSAKLNYLQSLSKYFLELCLVGSAICLAYYQFSTTSASRAIATLTIFFAASARIVPAILRLQQGVLKSKSSLAMAQPTIEMIDDLGGIEVPANPSHTLSVNHAGFRGCVEVKDLSFQYNSDCPIIADVSLNISEGEFIGIVGSSGAGKTTLVDLMLGILNPNHGSVKISNLEPKEAFRKWPGSVAYVSQDSPIINGSIKQNLCLGFNYEEIDDDQCWKALRQARLEDFVKSLPKQLKHHVGDRGTGLSGGQRQRLGIARALISNPKLLILDEATSSLDASTEELISDSFKALSGKITLVVIAHRLSTIVNADCIYYLDEGAIKGKGTFKELTRNFPNFRLQAELMGIE
jgi:ATP-binding cassette, subfamily B, bacterial PglK